MHGGYITDDAYIDFSVSLNPYRSREAESALEEALSEAGNMFGTYPDIDQKDVRTAIAGFEGVGSDRVIAGNGSSEILLASVRAISPKCALLIEPCFGGYSYVLNSLGECRIKRYFLSEENGFALTEEVLDVITEDIDLVLLCDPWNPTGKNIEDGLIRKVLERAYEVGSKVVLDRSFFMLSDKSLKYTSENTGKLCKEFPNLIIVNSFTKFFSLPGIRMGYAISCTESVKMLKNQLPEWNLPTLSNTLMSRLAAIVQDSDFHKKSLDLIKTERTFLQKKLSDLGIKVYESETNFILIKTHKDTYEKLFDKKIVIRRCDDFEGLGEGFFRIAVRGHEDNLKLLDALG